MVKKGQKMTSRIARKQAKILGIGVNSTSKTRVLRFVRNCLAQGAKFFIITPNPEQIMLAQKDKKFAKILNSADLALPDGIGLVWAAKFLRLPGPRKVIKGREMFLELIKLANKKTWKVFLLGGREKVAEKTKNNLEKSFKKVKIRVTEGPNLDNEAKPVTKEDSLIEKDVMNLINKFKPHLLFVAFGAPKQEKWVYKWLEKLECGGVMVVGGTFDYLAGSVSLPPKWIGKLGFEWLWRLICQPWRFKRIFRSVIIFPLKVFWSKLSS
jgi:N-acetylglucosaminyldiphosphoundecaprenol N-acetyl-beta-D-mannosaminyltransferase